MGLGSCKVCNSDDITVSTFGQGTLILCNDCGLPVKADTLEEAEERWNNLEVVQVGSERGKVLTAMGLLTAASLAASLPLEFGFGVIDNPLARLARKKEPKVMGPGAGTSRMRRIREGKKA